MTGRGYFLWVAGCGWLRSCAGNWSLSRCNLRRSLYFRDLRFGLSCRDGDGVSWGLGVGDAIFDSGHELWQVSLYHLLEARPKLVVEVTPGVAANRRTKIVEGIRSRSRPRGTVSSVHGDRRHHAEEVPSVQPPFSGVVTRDKNARSCVGSPPHKTVAHRRVIT